MVSTKALAAGLTKKYFVDNVYPLIIPTAKPTEGAQSPVSPRYPPTSITIEAISKRQKIPALTAVAFATISKLDNL